MAASVFSSQRNSGIIRFQRSFVQFAAASIALAFLFSLTGCQSLPLKAFDNQKIPVANGDSAGMAGKGQYRVEMDGVFTKTSAYVGEIKGDTTVQDALEAAGAIAKYRHMNIMVLRKTNGGQGLKMPVEMQPGKREVKFEQNYALHHGDRVMVQAETSGPLQQAVGGFFGKQ